MTAPRVRQPKFLDPAAPSSALDPSTLAEPGIVDQIFDKSVAAPVTPELQRLLSELNLMWPLGARSSIEQGSPTEEGRSLLDSCPRNFSGDLSDASEQSDAPTGISDYEGPVFAAVTSSAAASHGDERLPVSDAGPLLAKLASALDDGKFRGECSVASEQGDASARVSEYVLDATAPSAALSYRDERLARSMPASARSWPPLVKLASALGEGKIDAGGWYHVLRLFVVLVLLGSCIGGLVVWPRQAGQGDTPAEKPEQSTGPLSKISDRLEPSQSQIPATPVDIPAPVDAAPVDAGVPEPVALYEEDPTEPAGKRFVGSAIWSTKTVLVSPGRAPELEISADIKIPERSLTITWSLRRSIEQELPANYAVEIVFTPLPGAPSGVPANVLGVALKVSEQIRGVRLRGPIVKLTDGMFRIDLSTGSNRKSNMQLLQERPLFDISIVDTNNRRAILALSKGATGKRVFDEVYRSWGNN